MSPNTTQKFLNLWGDILWHIILTSGDAWRRLGLALLWVFALEFTGLYRNTCSLGWSKPGYKQNLILPRGKVFSMDHILTLGLPSSCCSLGAHPLMTIYTRGLCITLYSKGHLHPNQTISATLPGLGPTLKHPQWLFCLFCAALSGTRLITWSLLGLSLWGRLMQRNTKWWAETLGVLQPELPVFLFYEPGSDKLLKGKIPKGRLWICDTCPVWCERKGVAVLQAQMQCGSQWRWF